MSPKNPVIAQLCMYVLYKYRKTDANQSARTAQAHKMYPDSPDDLGPGKTEPEHFQSVFARTRTAPTM